MRESTRRRLAAATTLLRGGGSNAGIAAFTVANLGLVFLQQVWVTTTIGPGSATDAYFAAMAVPQFIVVLVSGPIASVLLPLLSTEDAAGRKALFWTSLHGVGLATLLITAVLAVLAPMWIPLTVPGLRGETRALAIDLTRVQLLYGLLASAGSIQAAAHRAGGSFIRAEASTLAGTVVGFVVLVTTLPRFGVAAAAWTLVLRTALAFVLMLRGLGGYSSPRWRAPAAREFGRRSLVLFSATTLTKSDILVDRFLASLAPAGALTLFNLAQTLYSSLQLVLNRALVLPVVPRLAKLAQSGRVAEFHRLVRRGALATGGAALAALLAITVVGLPALELVFARGAFDPAEVRDLWFYLLLLGGMLVAGAAGQVVASAYYASGAITRVSRIAISTFALGLVLKVAAFAIWGVPGVAGAASLYFLVTITCLIVGLSAVPIAVRVNGPPTEAAASR